MEFAKYVSRLRKKRGMSQKELAETLGFTPQGISRFESLDSAFDLNLIPALCKALDCSLSDIFRRVEDPHYSPFTFDLALVSRNIKELREKAGITQSSLAESAGITERSLRAYERGNATPSYQICERICRVLNVDIGVLFVHSISVEPPITPRRLSPLFWMVPPAVLVLTLLLVLIPTFSSSPLEEEAVSSVSQLFASTPTASSSEVVFYSEAPFSNTKPHPNRLAAKTDRNIFKFVGDEILLTLYDPDGSFRFKGLDGTYSLSYYTWDVHSSMNVAFEDQGNGKVLARLLAGNPGELVYVTVDFDEQHYDPVSYLMLYDGTGAKVAGTGQYIYEGIIQGSGQNELSVNYKHAMTLNGQCFLTGKSGETLSMPGGWWLELKTMPANLIDQDKEACGYSCPDSIGCFSVSFPDPSLCGFDDVYVFFAPSVLGEGDYERPFYLKPWHIHLER